MVHVYRLYFCLNERLGLCPDSHFWDRGIVQVRDILHKHRERGALIIIACHDSEELNYLSDETIIIEDGNIVDKTMNYS